MCSFIRVCSFLVVLSTFAAEYVFYYISRLRHFKVIDGAVRKYLLLGAVRDVLEQRFSQGGTGMPYLYIESFVAGCMMYHFSNSIIEMWKI